MNYYNSFVPDGNNNVTSGSTTTTTSSAAAPLQQSQYPQQSTGLSYFSQPDPRNAVAPPQQQPHYQQQLHRQELRQADQSSLVHFQPYLQHPPPQHQPQLQQPQHQSYTAPSMSTPTTTTTVYLSNLSPSSSSSSHNQSIASPPSALATLLAKLSKKHSCLIAPEVIPILEKNCFDETNVLYLDKETLVELQIPIGGRVSLLKIIEEEKKCTSNNNDDSNNKQIPHYPPSTTTIPFQGQNFLNHFVVPYHQANNINHHQNFHHHHEQQEQFQQRPGDRYLRDPELRRAAVVNAQDPELRALFNSSIHREDWILPPSDEQLREKLVKVWGGFDPWNETTCERCKKWAFKVTVEWLPRANRHPTEKCMIFAEDGTPVKQFDRRTLPSSSGSNHQNNDEQISFHDRGGGLARSQLDGAKRFGNIVNNGQYQHHHHHDRFKNFQQQQQQTKYHQHQNNNIIHQDTTNNNQQLHNNNSNNNSTTKTLDPELKQLLQSRFNGADWIDPPADPQLRAKLVAWWGGRDPWNETICDKCRRWSHKVTQDFYPRSTHHTTDKCAIWADDGTCIKSVAGSGARGQHHTTWSDRQQFANNNNNNTNQNNNNNNHEQQAHQTVDFVDVYYQEDEAASSESQSLAGAQKMSGQRREREENDQQ